MNFISEWKVAIWRTTETWESNNCSSGTVTITRLPEVDKFVCRDTNGMLVSSSFFDTFEEAAKLMESCFDWTVKVGSV